MILHLPKGRWSLHRIFSLVCFLCRFLYHNSGVKVEMPVLFPSTLAAGGKFLQLVGCVCHFGCEHDNPNPLSHPHPDHLHPSPSSSPSPLTFILILTQTLTLDCTNIHASHPKHVTCSIVLPHPLCSPQLRALHSLLPEPSHQRVVLLQR